MAFAGRTHTHPRTPLQPHELDHRETFPSMFPLPGGTRLVCEGSPPGPHTLPGAFTARILTDKVQAASGFPRWGRIIGFH